MNQIYYFDSYSPPLLNEAMLRRERERRREQRAIAAAATGGALILLCLLTLAFSLFPVAPKAVLCRSDFFSALDIPGFSGFLLLSYPMCGP